jgi:hypothetical protein
MSAQTAPRKSWTWLQGLACGALATLATPSALVLGAYLLPAVTVYLLDPAPNKPAGRAALFLGLAMTLAPMIHLWTIGHSMDTAWRLLSDPTGWMTSWLVQGMGWLAAEALPLCIGLALDAHAAARSLKLRSDRQKCLESWDLRPPADAGGH